MNEISEKEFDDIITENLPELAKEIESQEEFEMFVLQTPENQDFDEIVGGCDDVENISEANDETDD